MPDDFSCHEGHILSSHFIGFVDGSQENEEAMVIENLHILGFVLLKNVLQVDFDNCS